jgi:hypothetical protein
MRDDPLTDKGKSIEVSNDWIIQTWHDGRAQEVLKKGHRIIISETDAFYIGNADYDKVASFLFPKDMNVLGFEIVWFTSEGNDPYDFRKGWVMEPLRDASEIRRKRTCTTLNMDLWQMATLHRWDRLKADDRLISPSRVSLVSLNISRLSLSIPGLDDRVSRIYRTVVQRLWESMESDAAIKVPEGR